MSPWTPNVALFNQLVVQWQECEERRKRETAENELRGAYQREAQHRFGNPE
jgi:hypothetical protein